MIVPGRAIHRIVEIHSPPAFLGTDALARDAARSSTSGWPNALRDSQINAGRHKPGRRDPRRPRTVAMRAQDLDRDHPRGSYECASQAAGRLGVELQRATRELRPRLDAELAKSFVQVVLNRAGADE